MAKLPVFKTDFGETAHITDPESLFRDLRGRSPEIKHLWSHQADLLRVYHQKFQKAKDVAIELPTGAGKTLVGLLVAEFRRQSFKERIAYLCPTRQLARQVGAQAVKYGIKAHVFVGKQRDYPPGEFSEFQASEAIAVTTYSGVFNSNPRIRDAHSLVLDDAHASEGYIGNLWAVEVVRSEYDELYNSIVALMSEGLPQSFYAKITSDEEERESSLVELIPGKYIRKYMQGFRELVDQGIAAESPPWYSWQLIRDHVGACGGFVSAASILIRPFIPPALTHPPFTQANQRLYMSATLGAGGELERITGVNRIDRVPLPPGWDKRGSGRRLFLVPQISMSDDEALKVVVASTNGVDRTLVLAPNQFDAEMFRDLLRESGKNVLGATDIEDSLAPFAENTKTALVLSRYDGLDLPDDICRLLIFGGLPTGTNLQEKFLWTRVAAFSLLRDRVLTRFTQGVGRCTRSDNDYAVVYLWGQALVDFVLKQENRHLLQAELQAELQFGIENSRDKTADDFAVLSQIFIAQGIDWQNADEAIVRLREQCARQDDPISNRLRSSVSDEVAYLYAMWHGDLEAALQSAGKVADSLEGEDTKGYRGWWYYLAADAAMALSESTGQVAYAKTAKDCLGRASKCCIALSWFARLAREADAGIETEPPDELTALAVEKMCKKISEWGSAGKRFEREVDQTSEDLQATDYKRYHRGLKSLGEMLGFDADIPAADGDPDCIWSLGSDIHIAHEAKSDHSSGDPIGINDIRQAQSHEDWVRTHCSCTDKTQVLAVVESPRTVVAEKALAYSKSLCHVRPDELKRLADEIASVLRKARATGAGMGDERALESLHKDISAAGLTPLEVFKRLAKSPVSAMKTA